MKGIIMLKKAFTMAEIMIAMSVIGVISVLVLPSVTNGTSAKQFLVTYKKSLSVLNQAVDSNFAMSGWDFAGTRENYKNAVGNIFTQRLGAVEEENGSWTINGTGGAGFTEACQENGYATHGQVCFNANSEVSLNVNPTVAGTKVFTMKDGLATIIMLGEDFGTEDQIPCRAQGQRTLTPNAGYSAAANYCLAYLDLNGSKGPNQIVSCNNGVKNSGQIRDDITVDGCQIGSRISDVIPIIIFGDTVAPASAAGLAIFQEKFAN